MPSEAVTTIIRNTDNLRAPTRTLVQVTALWHILFTIENSTSWTNYRVSVDGGDTWSSDTTIFGNIASQWFDIYYERWNGNDKPNVIHVAAGEDASTTSDVFYNTLDLTSGSVVLGTPVSALFLGNPTLGHGSWSLAVTPSGRIRIDSSSFTVGARQGRWSDDGVTWANTGDMVSEGIQEDRSVGWADLTVTEGMSWIYLDESVLALSLKRGLAQGGGITETAIATLTSWADGNLATALHRNNGHIYVVAWDSGAISATTKNLKTWDIYGGTITARTNVITTNWANQVAMSILSTGAVYVFYTRDSAAASTNREIYYKISNDGMVTWGAETLYDDRDSAKTKLIADPSPAGGAKVVFTDSLVAGSATLWEMFPSSITVVYPAFVLMLAEESDRDIPVLDITSHNAANPGEVLTKVERGRERAVLGEPPRAGAGSTWLANPEMSRYDVEHPLPGLALRLNKFVNSVEYNLWTGDLDVPQHKMTIFRPGVSLTGYGRLSRLAGRKVTTALYEGITTGVAIGHLLDAAGFPAVLRQIAAGVAVLEYWWLTEADALSELNKLVNTEGVTAELYEDGWGRLVFRDRNARYTDARSTVAQNTLRSEGVQPWLTDFDYYSGYREIVNQATHVRRTRFPDVAPSVVWSEPAVYLLGPNESITIYASSSEPFKDAITPVLDTDYSIAWGSVSVSLDRTSGSRVGITFTAGAGGVVVGYASPLTAMQLRATSIPQPGSDVVEESTIDASASIAQYGLRPWSGEMWPEVTLATMRDALDGLVIWKQVPRGRIRIKVEALEGVVENLLTAERTIGDRIRTIESELGVDAQVWIERVEHEIQAPARHIAHYECSVIDADISTNPFDDIDNGASVLPPGSGFDEAHPAPSRLMANLI